MNPYFTIKIMGRVGIASLDKRVNLDNLCNMLIDEVEYEKAHDRMSIEAYESIILPKLIFLSCLFLTMEILKAHCVIFVACCWDEQGEQIRPSCNCTFFGMKHIIMQLSTL